MSVKSLAVALLILGLSLGEGECQTPIPKAGNLLRPGSARVDWSNPITRGLIGAYLPSNSLGPTIYDLAGLGTSLTVDQSGVSYIVTPAGVALSATGNNKGAHATPSTAQQPSSGGSVFWRGYFSADPGTSSSSFAGVVKGNNAFTGADGWGLVADTFGHISTSSTTGSVNNGTGFVVSTSAELSVGGTFNPGGNQILYVNGIVKETDACASGSFAYSGSPISMGYEQLVNGTRSADAVTYVEYLWNRALTGGEMAYLAQNPYGLLIFSDDELQSLSWR